MERINGLRRPTNYADVAAFHEKFGLPRPTAPTMINGELLAFRIKFMQEELDEYREAIEAGDMPKAFDALIDLVYVAMGTSVLHGFPWQAGWDEVQRANMTKERATSAEQSKRGTTFDVVKPEGWTAPNIEAILEAYVAATPRYTPMEADG
jgi:predicted HAD superfamily Cof-like phosphohydrolase